MIIRQLNASDHSIAPQLADLLIDVVQHGASIGFLASLSVTQALEYWQHTFTALGDGLTLWVAETDGQVLGTVQLAPCLKANGRHRAEVQKLMVRTHSQGQGIAAQLMHTLEAHARSQDIHLLVLDTLAHSPAAQVYQHLDWQKSGEIPEYATTPDGKLHATAYYFKLLSDS